MTTPARDAAETLALQALGWLASQDDLFPVFVGSTGVAPADLAQRAAEPEFLASVLDFILMDDRWVMDFCAAAGVPPDQPLRARHALPGGAAPDWT